MLDVRAALQALFGDVPEPVRDELYEDKERYHVEAQHDGLEFHGHGLDPVHAQWDLLLNVCLIANCKRREMAR